MTTKPQTLVMRAEAYARERCPGQDETNIVFTMCANDYIYGARSELEAVKDKLSACCKSKGWQKDEHWFAAEDLIDYIDEQLE